MKYFLRLNFCAVLLSIASASAHAHMRAADWSTIASLPNVKDSLATATLERQLLQDASDGHLNHHSLLQAVLVADGCHNVEQLGQLQRRVQEHTAKLAAITNKLSDKEKAKLILEYMHQHLLYGQYKEDCSSLRVNITQGHYNCVTSSVLYAYYARKLGLSVSFERTPGHVYCLAQLSNQQHPVETTSSNWEKSEDTAIKRKTKKRTQLTDAQMVSLIYYNRGVTLFQQHHYSRSIAQNYIALKFDPTSTTAKGNITSAINNWSLDFYEKSEYRKATAILKQGLALDHRSNNLLASEAFIYAYWIKMLREDRQYEQALKTIQSIPRRTAHRELICRNYKTLYQSWANDLIANDKVTEMFEMFGQVPNDRLSPRERKKILVSTVKQHATELFEKKQLSAAIELLEQGLNRYPDSITLQITRRTMEIQLSQSKPRDLRESSRGSREYGQRGREIQGF